MTFPEVQVRRLFRVVNGGTPTADSANWGGGAQWFTPEDLGSAPSRLLTTSRRDLTVEGLRSAAPLLHPGSLLLSTRAPIGHVGIVGAPLSFNQGCRGLVPRRCLDSRYFYWHLIASRARLQAAGQGSTFVELSSGALASFRICSPSVDQQRHIADYLDAEVSRIDDLVASRARQRELLTERHTVLVAGLVGAAGAKVRLAVAIASIEQGASPRCADWPAGPGECGVLKLSAVSARGFSSRENKFLAEDVPAIRAVVRDGDLLVTRANTPTLVGLAAVARLAEDDVTLLLPDLIYRLNLRKGHDPDYVQLALSTPDVRSQMTAAARGSSQSMVKLRGEDLRELRLPLPAIDRQQAIASEVRSRRLSLQRALTAIDRQIALLGERRQALITAAVTGRLQVPNAPTANANA